MKYCPICDERYDEEIIRFCTKDGTPLVDEEQPNFTALPSEASEETADLGEETIVRRKASTVPPTAPIDEEDLSGRIVIPTSHTEAQSVRPRTATTYYPPPPPQQNIAKTVILTIIGTLAVLGFGAGLFWMFQRGSDSNLNVNVNANYLNQNTNLNTNLGFDSNFNFNTNANFSGSNTIGTNLNTALRSPTPVTSPSPTPRTSPSPTPSPDDEPTPARSPTPRPSPVSTPSRTPASIPSPTPRTGPRPPALNTNRPTSNR